MLDKILLALLVLISPIIGSNNDLLFNPIDDYLCQNVETESLISDVLIDNEDSPAINSEVISCYSSDMFMLTEGVVEIEIKVNTIAKYDALSVIVYERGVTHNVVVAKKNAFLGNSQNDDNLGICFNVTSKETEGYVSIFDRQS